MTRAALASCLAFLVLPPFQAFAAEPSSKQPAVDLYGDPLPAGAKARLGAVRFRAGDTLMGLAFSADGAQLITATQLGPIRYWDAATGRRARDIERERERLAQIAFSADGRTALSLELGVDGAALGRTWNVRRWDLQAGKPVWMLSQEEEVGGFRASADGTRFLRFAPGDKLAVWDAVKGVALAEGIGPLRGAEILSPNGKLIAYSDGTSLRLLDWDGREPARMLAALKETEVVNQLTFSLDGKMLAAFDRKRANLWVIDTANGKSVGTVVLPDWKDSSPGIKFSPDGQWLALAGNQTEKMVSLWDLKTGKAPLHIRLVATAPHLIAFSPDSQRVAIGGAAGAVGIWEVKTGRRLGEELVAHDDPPRALAVLEQGKQVVTFSPDGLVCAWDVSAQKPRWHYRHGGTTARRPVFGWNWGSLVASPDGRRIVSTSFIDGTSRVLDAASGRELHRLSGYEKNQGSEGVFLDAERLVTGDGGSPLLRIWNVTTGKTLSENPLRIAEGAFRNLSNNAHAFSGDGRRFGIAVGRNVHMFETETGVQVARIETPASSTSRLALSHDAKRLAVCQELPWRKEKDPRDMSREIEIPAKNSLVRIYNVETGKLFRELDAPVWRLLQVTFSPDGTVVAAGSPGPDNLIIAWRVESGEELARFHSSDAFPTSLAISPDNKTLFSGMSDTSVLVWDLPTPK